MQTVWPGLDHVADLNEGLGARLARLVEGADERREHRDPVVRRGVAEAEDAGGGPRAGSDAEARARARGHRPRELGHVEPVVPGRHDRRRRASLDLDLAVAGGHGQPLDTAALELPDEVTGLRPYGLEELLARRPCRHRSCVQFSSIGGSTGWRPGAPNLRKRS